MATEYDLRLLAPFGSSIMKATMPPAVVAQLNAQADAIVAQDAEVAARDWSAQLAGVVATEVRVTDLLRTTPDVTDFIYDVARAFAYRCENALLHYNDYEDSREIADKALRVEIKEGWINDMVAGDYNPVHFHQCCTFSSVGFLRLPEGYEEEFQRDKAMQNTAGCLQFIDGRSAIGARNLLTVKPTVGEFYLWPSWMLHCVYPFRSPGVRRSVAINLALV